MAIKTLSYKTSQSQQNSTAVSHLLTTSVFCDLSTISPIKSSAQFKSSIAVNLVILTIK